MLSACRILRRAASCAPPLVLLRAAGALPEAAPRMMVAPGLGAPHALASITTSALLRQTGDPAFAFASEEDKRKVLGRLIYRSKQRGWLELDLLMGMWAEENLPTLDPAALMDYSLLLDEENPDLFKWLTGQEDAPERMAGNVAFKMVHAHVAAYLEENAAPGAKAAVGAEWKRGWTDSGGELSGGEGQAGGSSA